MDPGVAGLVWSGINTLQHERGATPSPELLERVRSLFPYIEERSAGGYLATSGMTCSETIIREGTSLCVGGHVVNTPGKTQFRKGRGKLKVVATPTRGELLQQLKRTARSYWVTATALVAVALLGHVLQLYQYPAVWVFGGYGLSIFAWFLWDSVSV